MLALRYLRETDAATPEASLQFERNIALGYQRLLTFEVDGGGFDWYGKAPANVLLTAYGLLQFADMATVWPQVERAVLRRSRDWLVSQQGSDGSWTDPRYGGGAARDVATTALVLRALAATGPSVDGGGRPPQRVADALRRARALLVGRAPDADDPYVLSMAALAIAGMDGDDVFARRLAEKASSLGGEAPADPEHLVWAPAGQTLFHGSGLAGQLETTALTVRALLATRTEKGRAERGLRFIAANRDERGSWHSTQATVLAIQALLQGRGAGGLDADASVEVRIGGRLVETIALDPANADVIRQVDLSQHVGPGASQVDLALVGPGAAAGGGVTVQLAGRYYLPWAQAIAASDRERAPMTVAVAYDRTTLAQDDFVDCHIEIEYLAPDPTFMVIVDVGIPPGFAVDRGSLAELVGSGAVDRFETTGRQVILYLGDMRRGRPVTLTYALRAVYPVRAKAPGAVAYEYYTPERRAEAPPVDMEVTER